MQFSASVSRPSFARKSLAATLKDNLTNIRRHKKRLYYTSGIISLVLLPILCVWYLQKQKAFEKPRVLEINWWFNWNKHSDDFSFDVHPERRFVEIKLTGDDNENIIRLNYSQLEVRKPIESKDTTTGVHFIFEDNSKYWTFIRAVDICKIEKAVYFVPKDNDLWVFNYAPRPVQTKMNNIPLMGPCVINFPTEEQINEGKMEEIEERNKYIIETAKTYSISGILFIVLLFLGIRRLYRT